MGTADAIIEKTCKCEKKDCAKGSTCTGKKCEALKACTQGDDKITVPCKCDKTDCAKGSVCKGNTCKKEEETKDCTADAIIEKTCKCDKKDCAKGSTCTKKKCEALKACTQGKDQIAIPCTCDKTDCA